jgi:hypothetical protein|nr:MAG TPA: hypothetical protein [Bacteriophage sp.]
MTDKEKEIVQALRCCAKGLGHDDACENCKVGEIQDRREYIEFAAANVIERLTAENVVLPDGQASALESLRKEIEWKDMVIALAQRKQAEAEAERDAALADLADARSCKTCKYACDTRDCSNCKSKTCKCSECHLDKNAWEWRGLPETPEEGEI